MNYLKSGLAGLAAVFVIFVVFPMLAVLGRILIFAVKHGFEGGVSLGPLRWAAPSLAYWFALVSVFAIAYLWELRRLTK